MNEYRRKALLLLVVGGIWSFDAIAQKGPGPGPGPLRGPAAERVEQFKKIRLMEVLNLDEQASIRFFARYNKHQEAIREIRWKQIDLFQQIQMLRKSNAADAEYDKVLGELRSLEVKSNDRKLKFFDELGEVLNKKQLAEYIVFELRFQQNLREVLRGLQREREDRMKP